MSRRFFPARPLNNYLRYTIRAHHLSPPLCWLVHHGVFGRWETLLDVMPGSLRFRRINRRKAAPGPWRRRRLNLARPHRVVVQPDGSAIVADTQHDRLVVLPHLEHGVPRSRSRIGGRKLVRPHDVVWNAEDRCHYVIDAHALYRLPSPTAPGEAWAIHRNRLGYARGVSVIDGKVHIIASTRGSILRVDNFAARKLTEFCAPGKRRAAPAGSWLDTGLVPNDLTHLDGWYYATNYFSPDHARRGAATRYRFIRWRTWEEFRAGAWQDLSAVLPAGLVPYFMTVVKSAIHVVVFCHADHGRDGVLTFHPDAAP